MNYRVSLVKHYRDDKKDILRDLIKTNINPY